jgi:hypothetical protein
MCWLNLLNALTVEEWIEWNEWIGSKFINQPKSKATGIMKFISSYLTKWFQW